MTRQISDSHIYMQPHHSPTINRPLAIVAPGLPPDLERLIFELAARDVGPKGSTTLLLVAKRVHDWIRPLIYRVFNQMATHPFPDFHRADPQLLENIGHLAEKLLVGYNPASKYSLKTLLSFCPNIVDLAIWESLLRVFIPATAMDKLPLRRLSAHFSDFMYEDFLNRPFFVGLTHLDVLSFMGVYWNKQFEALTHLPNLTHLSISCSTDFDVIPQLLRHCRLLRIFMLTPDTPYLYFKRNFTKEELAEINDHRFLLLECPPFPGLVHDWEKGARGGIDFWAFGELVSLAQTRNYFIVPSPLYFPRVGFDWKKHLNIEGLEWFSGLQFYDPWPPTEQDE
ncbi:hypothetical protein M413DRAFT_192527 [Hebeloma cylindrosporum]|uniref:Uncharacterized protein n=1 Tax=Hebeloma cylindrosporum TaxID=76867 RepID=A0A0C3C7E7_HEBCY|nr:hypothetical protein M413DRAFT_192527 [Hebeloma cylindrosporum h7]